MVLNGHKDHDSQVWVHRYEYPLRYWWLHNSLQLSEKSYKHFKKGAIFKKILVLWKCDDEVAVENL